MKISKTSFALCLTLNILALKAMEKSQPQIICQSKDTRGSTIICKGLLVLGEHPRDQFQISVSHDSATGVYSGGQYHNGYCPTEWYFKEFSSDDAKKYFQALTE